MSQSPEELGTTEQPANAPQPQPPAQPSARRNRNLLRILLAGAGIGVFLLLFAMISYTLFAWTESTEFCSTCHNMYPEATAHSNSPHARTNCGTCHVGPGAVAAVKAKIENARYVYLYPLNKYPRPIPSPIHSLRPATVVCEQCHWPEKFYADRLITIPGYAEDEKNTRSTTMLLLRTGGGTSQAGLGRGIHWHIENAVFYVATDEKRQDIPWVKATFNGVTTEYISADSTLTPEAIAKAEKRKMDCVDCHNRATHAFPNPSDALDVALSTGTIPADLPYIKREGVKVLMKQYASEAEAAKAIAAEETFYKTTYPDVYAARKADVQKAVAGLQMIFDNTQFPFMKLTWQSHTDNVGHLDFPGCFRCHDGKHLSKDKQAIRLECNVCHSIPQVSAGSGAGVQIGGAAPLTMEPASHQTTTWLSQHRFQFDNTCESCHTVDNPGGSDNTSFCSNSACHGTQWKFSGLNAPQIRQLAAPVKAPSAGTPAAIPHPIGARTDCLLCHAAGKTRPFPDNHSSFKVDVCTTCHKTTVKEDSGTTPAPAPTAVPTKAGAAAPTPAPTATSAPAPAATTAPGIPHPLAGRDNCLLCHDPNGNVKPAPMNHVGRTVDTCQMCHKVR